MTKSIGSSNDYLNEIIRLQLKKPKRWNWELTTSSSSPSIALPVIQLFNAKGKLLVEAKESGNERRSWHSNDWVVNNGDRASVNDLRPLRKCTSDILQRNAYDNSALLKYDQKKLSTNSLTRSYLDKDRSPFGNRSNSDRSQDVFQREPNLRYKNETDGTIKRYMKSKSATALEKLPISHGSKDVVPNIQNSGYTLNLLEKKDFGKPRSCMKPARSRSLLVSEDKSNNIGNEDNGLRKSKSTLVRFNENMGSDDKTPSKSRSLQGYRRSKSDVLYRSFSNRNEESLKRAVTDGYKKFLNADVDRLNNNVKVEKMNMETVEVKKPEVNRVKYSKYITRTCSAGTLIIKEESFNNPNLRRRRKTADCDPGSAVASSNFRRKELYPKRSESAASRRDISYPHMLTHKDRSGCEKRDSLKLPAYDKLVYAKGDIFPFGELFHVNSNYTVEEPSSGSRKNSEEDGGAEKLEAARRRKIRRRFGEKGSLAAENMKDDGMRASAKARVVKEHKKDAISDEELLRLVRGLSSNDHAKMGANVSRHSSKGLSGRRTQSSGSICNGKGGGGGGGGRHTNSEPKICGSLPSYLDERDGTGCNNNHHECEKPPLQDVERIPPLGDGAPLHWKFSDTQTVLCDQGYGSERSPEEEYPPPLPEHDNQCHHHLDLHSCYPFITPESTFTVSLAKGSRGLGLSVTGGVDSGGSWPGLIRVKRLFPHQPAASCEMLNVGDLILEVNGITLTGLTNYEALEVLRTASNQVELKICRPPPDVLSCVSPISEVPPPPPRREPPTSLNLTSTSDDEHSLGEFEVTMRKLQGSLGFTLRKEDDSALGHYIRALVREPALTDSRIRAGDKIIAVNDVEISSMTHEEAVQFLRQSGEIVKLRLYRDLAQTPVATLSPTETTPRTSFSKKTQLRQEAVDMLNDIAVRKLIPGNQDIYGRRSQSPNTSPRRLRRQPCPSDASHISDSSSRHLITDEQFHEGLLKKCSLPLDEDSFNSLFIEDDDCDKPSRPSSLDLYNPNQTPVAMRKPKFNFSLAHNAYELNNLDAEILDAPNLTYNLGAEDVNSTEVECGDSFPQEPASMPHIPTDNPGFSYRNPAYQSAHPQCGTDNGDEKTPKALDDSNMKKWKGVVFTADEERERDRERERQRSLKAKTAKNEIEDKYEILAIELNRGWNSRLGFSLQGAAGVTYVSAVHADSVAARDGRIKPGDCLIKVNDESVEHMTTSEIIDLLRIVRGPVCIVVSRPKSKEDCTKSNAAVN